MEIYFILSFLCFLSNSRLFFWSLLFKTLQFYSRWKRHVSLVNKYIPRWMFGGHSADIYLSSDLCMSAMPIYPSSVFSSNPQKYGPLIFENAWSKDIYYSIRLLSFSNPSLLLFFCLPFTSEYVSCQRENTLPTNKVIFNN